MNTPNNGFNLRPGKLSGAIRLLLAATVIVLGLGHQSAFAVSATWNGTTDLLWSTTTNWSTSPVPTTGQTATFNNAGNSNTIITTGSISLTNITFDTASAAAYTLGATPGTGNITFANGTTTAVTMNSTVTNNQIINANLTLGTAIASNTAFTNNSTAGLLTLGGNITGGTGGTAAAKTVTVTGDGNTTIGGVISTGSATSLALTKTGLGTLTLTGSNTYTGLTTVSGGTLAYGANNTIFTGAVTVNGAGAALAMGAFSDSVGLVTLTDGSITGTGTLTSTSGFTMNSANATSVSAILGGAVGLTKSAAGTLTLSGSNTYTGLTTVSGGILKIDAGTGALSATTALTLGGGTFDYDNTTAAGARSQNMGALTFSTARDSTVAATRTASQNVTLTFSSLAARAAGATGNFVYGGTPGTIGTDTSINLTGRAAGFIDQGTFLNGSNYAWVNAAGTYVRGITYNNSEGFTSGATTTLAAQNHWQTTGAISAQNTATFLTLNLSGNNDFTLDAAQTLTVNGILKSGNTAGGATISGGSGIRAASAVEMVVRTDGTNDALTINTPILANGANAFTKSGAGTLTFGSSAVNTYTGINYLNQGTTVIVQNSNLGAVATGAAINLNNATLQANATFALDNAGANSRAITLTNVGTLDVTGTNTLTVSGNVNGTNGSLVKSNTGTLTLTNSTNTSLLNITIAAGTLEIGGAGRLGNGSLHLNMVNNGTLLWNSSANQTFANTTTFSGSGGITKQGAGLLDLQGTYNYTGNVTLNSGTLKVSTSSADTTLGSGASELSLNGGELWLRSTANGARNYARNTTVGGDVTITVDHNVAGAANYTFGTLAIGAQTLTVVRGAVTPTSGNLIFGNATMTGASTFTVNDITQLLTMNALANSGFTPTFNGTGNVTLTGTVSGAGGLTQAGSGTLILSAANTFSGSTTVTSGILQLNNSLALQNSTLNTTDSVTGSATAGISLTGSSARTLGGLTGNKNLSTLFTTSNGYSNLTALTLNPGTGKSDVYTGGISDGAAGMTLTKTGLGTQTLSGNNTYTGATTVNEGTLLINGSTSSSSAVTVANGGVLGGYGTIGGLVTVNFGGTLAPGNSPGRLTVGSLVLEAGSTTAFEINGIATAGTDYDQIVVTTASGLTLAGAFTIDFTNLIALSNTTDITLFSYTGTHSDRFASLNSTGFYAGAWTYNSGGDVWTRISGGQTLTFSESLGSLTVVPEPSTWALLAFSLTTALVFRRRRRQEVLSFKN